MTERLHFHFSLSCIGEGNDNPLQCSCLENPRDGEAWWDAVSGDAQSRTRLKQLSISSSNSKLLSGNYNMSWKGLIGKVDGGIFKVATLEDKESFLQEVTYTMKPKDFIRCRQEKMEEKLVGEHDSNRGNVMCRLEK